jgi:hypothetical protein
LNLWGENICWTYEGALPANLDTFSFNGSNIYWTYEGILPSIIKWIGLEGDNIHWTYEGALPQNLTYLWLEGINIHWTYVPWNFANNFSEYTVYTGTPHTQENIISVLNKAAKVTWVNYKNIYLSFPNASMADTTQGGIWGNFSDISNFQPNQVAIDLKNLVKVKNVIVTLNGVSMPSTTNDGIGFPENFGAWWNENYIGVLDYNNSPASLYFNFSDNVEVSIKGYGYLYDDASCITNPQSTKTYTAGLNYIYFKTDSISTIRISNKSKVIGLGSEDICFNNNSNYKLKIDLNFFGNVTKINLQGNVDLIGTLPSNLTYLYLDNIYWESKEALPESLTYFHLYGDNIHWTYTGVLYPNPVNIHFNNVYWTYKKELPSGLTYLHLEGSNIYFTYEEVIPSNLTYLHLKGDSIGLICTEVLPSSLIHLYLEGNNIYWTYIPWNFAQGFSCYYIGIINILHTQENIVSVLNKGALTTWVSEGIINLENQESMADTEQGGIWGDFSDIDNFQPSQVAIDLKTLVKVENVTVKLNGISMPGATGDGTGFPQNFGTWWRS